MSKDYNPQTSADIWYLPGDALPGLYCLFQELLPSVFFFFLSETAVQLDWNQVTDFYFTD